MPLLNYLQNGSLEDTTYASGIQNQNSRSENNQDQRNLLHTGTFAITYWHSGRSDQCSEARAQKQNQGTIRPQRNVILVSLKVRQFEI